MTIARRRALAWIRPVAQIWWPFARTLLYRRIVFCGPTTSRKARGGFDALPILNRRYSRLQICATRLAFSMLLAAFVTLPALGERDSRFSDLTGFPDKPVPPGATTNLTSTGTNSSPLRVTNSMDVMDDKHLLAIGDRLSFRIEEDRLLSVSSDREQDDTKPLLVTDTGEIDVPYIGRLPAENKTCKQLAGEIKVALEKDYYQQATVVLAVDLMTKSRGKVYLVGPVRAPGPQDIPSDEVLTLSRAILRAGGFTDFADRKHVKVTRKAPAGGEKRTFVVDVGQILDKGKTETDLLLQAEDLIYIPERLVRF